MTRLDVAPPGREKQVQALKEKSSVENPYAVAWASYEGDALVVEGYASPIVPEEHADVIKKRGGSWVLLSKKTGKVLGTHETKEQAEAQERAVQANKHADGVRVLRVDRSAALRPPARLPNGFVRFDGNIARIGVQQYVNPDGSIRRELRLPEEVFKADSVASFAQMPVTNNHPPGLLDAGNARMHVVGAVGESVRPADDFLAAPLMVYDAGAIAAVEAGQSQLSCGYSCELEHSPGRWDAAARKITNDPAGEPFDFIQRDIQGNHVALVMQARAGAGASLRLDADGNAVLAFKEQVEAPQEIRHMKIKIGTLHLDVTDANAEAIQAAHDAALAAEKKVAQDAKLSETVRADAAEAKVKEIQAKLDAAQAKLDAPKMMKCDECGGSGKVDGAKCDNCDGKGKVPAAVEEAEGEKSDKKRSDSIRRMVARRVALERQAAPILGDEVKLDGLDDLAVKVAVVAKAMPEMKLDGRSPDYVEAAYAIALKQASKAMSDAPTRTDAARAAAAPAGQGERVDAAPDYLSAQKRFEQASRDAWKQPAAK